MEARLDFGCFGFSWNSAVIRAGAVVKHCIVAENVTIGENAVVGEMPSGVQIK